MRKPYYAGMHVDRESIFAALQTRAQQVHSGLFQLQWNQFQHDENYHREIARLPMSERIKHLVLHLAKYGGGLAESIEAENHEEAKRSIVDAFIISMSLANVLNIKLDEKFSPEDLWKCSSPQPNQQYGFLTHYMIAVGRACKAVESLDHVELYPSREKLNNAAVECVRLTASECLIRGIDISNCVYQRLSDIKLKNIFHHISNEGADR